MTGTEPALRAEWIEDERRLTELASPWNALAEGDPDPFARHAWHAAWWRGFGGGRRLETCALWDGGDLAAIFPLCRRRGALAALANEHTAIFRPAARDERALGRLCAEVLDRAGAELEVPVLPSDSDAHRALREGSRSAGRAVVLEPDLTSPIVDTSGGDFEAYRKATRPKWMARLARYRRKMDREYELDLSVAAPPADLAAELEAGFDLEASGWKGETGTAILSSAPIAGFYREIAEAYHAAGELRLSRIALDGGLVAFDLAILYGGRLYSLKTAFDESFRQIVPGLVLRLSIIEHCFEQGLEAHEFLGASYEWKRSFATGERRHVMFRSFSRGLSGAARHRWRRSLRPFTKRAYLATIGRRRAPHEEDRPPGAPTGSERPT